VTSITALNLLWLSKEPRPPHWDMARHLGDSLIYLNTFQLSHPLLPIETYTYYPPFTYWVTDLFYAFLGTGLWVAILSNAVFIAILAFASYGIGKSLWNRRIGLLSAIFVLTTPVMVSNFKEYMLDAPLTAMVALGLYLLIRTESFSRRRPSVLFGAACGLGLLTKWTFPFFLALPLVASGVAALGPAIRRRSLVPLQNLGAAAVVGFLICGYWYLHNRGQLSHDASLYSGLAVYKGLPHVASVSSLLWYFWTLLNYQLYAGPFVLFVIGMVLVFRRNDSAMRNLQPVLLILGTYVAFALQYNKDVRYTLPMLPAVGVVAISWTEYLKPRARRWLTGAIAAYGVVAFLAISFGTSLLPKDVTLGTGGTSPGVTFFAQHGYIIGPPSGERWYQDEVFRQIAHQRGRPTFWYEGPDSIWFNTWGIRYYSLRYHDLWVASPAQANFIVSRGRFAPPLKGAYVLIRHYPLPDGEALGLYERI